MGVISAAKGVTQISNSSEMAGPEQIMTLGDELAGIIGEHVASVSALPAAGALLNGAANWIGRTVYVENIDDHATWDGDEWKLRLTGDSGWVTITTFGTNWTATSGHPPRVRRTGKKVEIFGAVTWALGADLEHILTIPVGFRPTGTTYPQQFVASGTTNRGRSFTLYIPSPGDKLTLPPGYFEGSFSPPEVLPLLGGWYTD